MVVLTFNLRWNFEFVAYLVYMVSSRPVRAT